MRLVLAFLVALLPAVVRAQDSGSGSPPPSVLVTTETPRQGSLPRTLAAYGVVQAAPGGGSETLSVLRAARVTQVMARPGEAVHRGQALVVLTAEPAALAAYKQAVDALTLAKGERARTAQMLADRLATRDQLAQADKAVADAQTNLDALNRAGGGSAGQTLAAPFDGVVSNLPAAPGARVAAGTPLVTLDRTSRLVAAVGVEPAQRGLVAAGQPARIEALYGGGAAPGSVLSVGAMLDPATRLVPVLVDPPSSAAAPSSDGLALLPGAPVRVTVQVGAMRGWLVPRGAVLTDAKGAYVFQVNGGKAARVDVRVVGMAGDTTVVDGALDPQRALVTTGNYQLQGGEAVREAPTDADAGAGASGAKAAP